jgi:hypothetical protein
VRRFVGLSILRALPATWNILCDSPKRSSLMDRTCSTRAGKLLSWSPTLQPEHRDRLNLLHFAARVIKQKLSALFPQLPDISVPAETKADRMVCLTAISVHAIPVAPRRIPTASRIEQGRTVYGKVSWSSGTESETGNAVVRYLGAERSACPLSGNSFL